MTTADSISCLRFQDLDTVKQVRDIIDSVERLRRVFLENSETRSTDSLEKTRYSVQVSTEIVFSLITGLQSAPDKAIEADKEVEIRRENTVM